MDQPRSISTPKRMVWPATAAPSSTTTAAARTMSPRRRLLRLNRAEAPARRMKEQQMNRSRMFRGVENIRSQVMTPKRARS